MIGTNKKDATETVELLLADARAGRSGASGDLGRCSTRGALRRARGWQAIDAAERARASRSAAAREAPPWATAAAGEDRPRSTPGAERGGGWSNAQLRQARDSPSRVPALRYVGWAFVETDETLRRAARRVLADRRIRIAS